MLSFNFFFVFLFFFKSYNLILLAVFGKNEISSGFSYSKHQNNRTTLREAKDLIKKEPHFYNSYNLII